MCRALVTLYPPFDYTHYKETGRKIYNGRGINNG